MLAADRINHHKVSIGMVTSNPLDNFRLRDWVRS